MSVTHAVLQRIDATPTCWEVLRARRLSTCRGAQAGRELFRIIGRYSKLPAECAWPAAHAPVSIGAATEVLALNFDMCPSRHSRDSASGLTAEARGGRASASEAN
jgi:hypothetical protein